MPRSGKQQIWETPKWLQIFHFESDNLPSTVKLSTAIWGSLWSTVDETVASYLDRLRLLNCQRVFRYNYVEMEDLKFRLACSVNIRIRSTVTAQVLKIVSVVSYKIASSDRRRWWEWYAQVPWRTKPLVFSPLWYFFLSPGQYHLVVLGGIPTNSTHSIWNHSPNSHWVY